MELSKKDICWKCGGELKRDKQRKRPFYICWKCEEEGGEKKRDNKKDEVNETKEEIKDSDEMN